MTKTKQIETILSLTNRREDTTVFDTLSDKSGKYLDKLLTVIKALK